jgi:hypothetical protein
MKHRWLLITVVLLSFLMACSGTLHEQSYLQKYSYKGGRGQGFSTHPYRVSQEGHSCFFGEVSGRITRLRVETFSPDIEPGLAVDVQAPDRGLVHVHLGPLWFLEKREADLKPGDEVTIKAFCYKLAGKERLLAAEVKHRGHTIELCDPKGIPYWEAWQRR